MMLYVEVTDPKLLFKLMSRSFNPANPLREPSSTFYRKIRNREVEALYLHANRAIHFRGEVSEDQLKMLEDMAWNVSRIEVDQRTGTIKIAQ